MKKGTRVHIVLKAYWGNDDAESEIRVRRRRWAQIQTGAEFSSRSWSYYEGKRCRISWGFDNGRVSITDDNGMPHIVDEPLSSLIVFETE